MVVFASLGPQSVQAADEAPDALRHLIEGRPYGKVILTV